MLTAHFRRKEPIMADTKTIITRIKNKVDLISAWKASSVNDVDSTTRLLDGEIAIVRVPTGNEYVNPVTGVAEPEIALLMKVGDGTSTFDSLPWMSAKASDVYNWAKLPEEDFKAWVKTLVEVSDIDLSAYYTAEQVDNGFVSKEAGKSLVADSEIQKLVGVSVGANKVEASNNNGSIKIDGVDTVVYTPATPIDYTVTITEDATDSTIAKRYIFTQRGAEIGRIDLAKELVVTSGSVKEVTEAGKPYTGAAVGDKYIELVIANQETPIYVPAKDLVDIYTPQANAEEVQIAISATNEISATLTEAVKTKLNKAHEHANQALLDSYDQTNANIKAAIDQKHTHSFSDEPALNSITSAKVEAWDKAEQNAKDYAKAYADGLNHEDTKYTAAQNGGLKLDENNAFSIDDSITFIFDCGGAPV
jgi:hypothetical protein